MKLDRIKQLREPILDNDPWFQYNPQIHFNDFINKRALLDKDPKRWFHQRDIKISGFCVNTVT